jgi:predicted naringenin-chalcone synthase
MAPQEKDRQQNTMQRVDSESDMSVASDTPTKSYRDYRVRKSNLIGMVNWTHVIGTYIPHIFVAGIGILVALIFHQVINDLMQKQNIDEIELNPLAILDISVAVLVSIKDLIIKQLSIITSLRKEAIFSPAVEGTFLTLVFMAYILTRDKPVYLMAFSTFKAPESWKASHDQIIEMMRRQECFTEDSIDFMKRLIVRSGTGQQTAWPPGIIQCLQDGKKTDRSIDASRLEAETVIFDIVEKAMKKAKVTPKDIDVLVINCSLFSPTPSLCATVITHFKMRGDIMSYNLSGMGCGASLLAMDLAKNMLQRKKGGGRALVVSTEIITPNLYHGNKRGFLLQNILFRCGGAAMVLSNKWMDGSRAWFKLLHTVRVQGTSEDAYQCVFEAEDEDGHRGVRLSKEIVKVAGKTMEKNLTTLGPYVLPLSEQARVVISLAIRYAMKTFNKTFKTKKFPVCKVYVPDFKRGIDHFCIHAGGRAVIDGIEKNMKLELFHTEPSRMALLNFGNTSSSSIWYELEYIMDFQKNNPLKKGDRVMQVAFGSGFKCTSGVWLKL